MTRQACRSIPLFLITCFFAFWCGPVASGQGDAKNVLFIAIDDLRPELACYGKSYMKTPNFDRVAQQGVLFERAFCMVPTCGASRASVMGSVRPAPGRFTSYLTRLSKDAPNAVPLHSLLKDNGYQTTSLGKIFHHKDDHADGWSEPPFRPKNDNIWQDENRRKQSVKTYRKEYPKSKKKTRGPATESADVDDSAYGDGRVANRAVNCLNRFAENPEKPFFLAVGFFKPHLPFNAPKKYWDLYDRDEIELPANRTLPTDVPKVATHTSGELRAYSDIPPTGPVGDAKAKELIHGYRACVSYTDAQIGRVIDALEKNGQADNTIIVIWSDHGWQLGEHGMWNKHSCFETSMWTPLIVSVPGDDSIARNRRAGGIVELIDLYPTICELAGIELPSTVEGKSFATMLRDPDSEGKPFAIGRYKLGDTIRTDKFRYSEYRSKKNRNGNGKERKLLGSMLFNHDSDPTETENVTDREAFANDVRKLSETLNENKGR